MPDSLAAGRWPLIVPERCALRVGNETRPWREGKSSCLMTVLKSWNLSKELRVVMIFDVWHPELSEKDRIVMAAMLQAADQFERLSQRVESSAPIYGIDDE